MLYIAAILAYLLGSIPTSVWYSKTFFGFDIREKGSGNAGASNTFRTLGKKAGFIVLFVDILKGWAAAMLAQVLLNKGVIDTDQLSTFKLIFGFLAILGHLYPVFAQFRGGKGVATAAGLLLALQPMVALVCVGIFLTTLILSHYTSLSSLLSALAFPLLTIFEVFGQQDKLLVGFGFFVFLVVVYTHRDNIKRLLAGNENKIYLFKKKP